MTTPPIPASCVDRPTIGGVVIPAVNTRLADGGVDFRTPHHTVYAQCWTDGLCQVCGQPITHRAVLFGGPNQVGARRFDEPPLCVPCALYASQACPMVAGRTPFYADRRRLSDSTRGQTCLEPDCHCGGWTPTDPDVAGHPGDPAHPWFAVFIDPGAYAVLVYDKTVRCSDRGCEHVRRIVSGGQLTADPVKVMLVSAPGQGRVWRRLPPPEWPAQGCTAADDGD